MLPGKLRAAIAVVAAAVAMAASWAAVSWTVASAASTQTVDIVNGASTRGSSAYDPSDITITVGDSVTWTNRDPDFNTSGNGHSATAQGAWDTGLLHQNDSKTLTFNDAGTYTYHCTVHPSMTGTLHVNLPPGVTTTTTSTTTTVKPTTTTVKPTTTTHRTTTTTEPPTTTTRPPPPPPRPRPTTTTSTTTTTAPPTTTTQRLELSSPVDDNTGVDSTGGGGTSTGRFIVRLLLSFLVVLGGAFGAAYVVQRFRGGGA